MENRPRYRFVRVIVLFFHFTYNVAHRVVPTRVAHCAVLWSPQILWVGSAGVERVFVTRATVDAGRGALRHFLVTTDAVIEGS